MRYTYVWYFPMIQIAMIFHIWMFTSIYHHVTWGGQASLSPLPLRTALGWPGHMPWGMLINPSSSGFPYPYAMLWPWHSWWSLAQLEDNQKSKHQKWGHWMDFGQNVKMWYWASTIRMPRVVGTLQLILAQKRGVQCGQPTFCLVDIPY